MSAFTHTSTPTIFWTVLWTDAYQKGVVLSTRRTPEMKGSEGKAPTFSFQCCFFCNIWTWPELRQTQGEDTEVMLAQWRNRRRPRSEPERLLWNSSLQLCPTPCLGKACCAACSSENLLKSKWLALSPRYQTKPIPQHVVIGTRTNQ